MAYEEQCAGKCWPCGEEQEDREAAHGAAAEEWERGTDGRAKEAVRRAMRLLMSRDRSERELLERLGREGFGPEETGTALEYVKSYGYVNDRRYAENYVMSAGGKKSRAALRSFLLDKGIREELIEEALTLAAGDESVLIRRLLLKRAGQPHKLEDKELRRLYGYLARRGFSAGDIRHALRDYQDEALSNFFAD